MTRKKKFLKREGVIEPEIVSVPGKEKKAGPYTKEVEAQQPLMKGKPYSTEIIEAKAREKMSEARIARLNEAGKELSEVREEALVKGVPAEKVKEVMRGKIFGEDFYETLENVETRIRLLELLIKKKEEEI